MNVAHFHLAVNHVPLVGTLIGFLMLAVGSWRRWTPVVRAALGVFVFSALLAIPAFFSGEKTAAIIEDADGVSERHIHAHEEAAEAAFAAVEVAGAASLGALTFFRQAPVFPAWSLAALLGLGLVAGSLLGRAANLGGQIRHTEIRDRPSEPVPLGTEDGETGEKEGAGEPSEYRPPGGAS